MAPSPDLFVVCKTCQAEVSPYITECPYCGHRLRKRAPKLDKGGTPKSPRRARARTERPPRLGRLRRDEMPGIRGDRRPSAALGLVAVPAVVTLLATFGAFASAGLLVWPPAGDAFAQPWRLLTSALYYGPAVFVDGSRVVSLGSLGYEVVALAGTFLFGWLLERRHGPWAPLGVWLLGTLAGAAAAVALDPDALVLGGIAGAAALLGAWVVRDGLDARRGDETETDWLAVAAAAVLLAATAVIYREASIVAGLVGALVGLAVGVPLARARER